MTKKTQRFDEKIDAIVSASERKIDALDIRHELAMKILGLLPNDHRNLNSIMAAIHEAIQRCKAEGLDPLAVLTPR